MVKVRVGAVLIFVFLIFPAMLFGQDLGEMIEATEGTQVEEESLPPSTTEVQAQENTPPQENASWLGTALRTILGIGVLGPIGVIAGEALDAVTRDSTRVERDQERMKEVSQMGDQQRIQQLKSEIQRRFGVSILEAPPPSTEEGIPATRSEWETSAWTAGQLETIEDQLGRLPSSFVQCTKKIGKFKALRTRIRVYDVDREGNLVIDPALGRPRLITIAERASETLGSVDRRMGDTVNIFDGTFEGQYSRREVGLGKLRTVLVHEMTHCFQHQNPEVLAAWASKFWVPVLGPKTKYYPEEGFEVELSDLTRGGYWELGCPVSLRGGFLSRPPIGEEDMAEATALTAVCPAVMAERFSERYAFVKAQVLSSEGSAEGEGGGGEGLAEISANPSQFGYCQSAKWNLVESGHPGVKITQGYSKTDSYTEEFDKSDLNFGRGLENLRSYLFTGN